MKIRNMKQVKEHMKDMNMKRLFRRNQIIITTLAVMIAAAGYLNYAGKKDLAEGNRVYEAGAMDISDQDILAENQAASLNGKADLMEIPSLDQDASDLDPTSGSAQTESDTGQMAQADTGVEEATQAGADTQQPAQSENGSSQTGLENPGEAVLTSGMNVADYIANVQLSREQIRAKNKETLMGLINSASIDEAAKQQAIQDMIKLTEVSEKENAAETLLMAKGFADPVVSITEDKVDVVINAPSITDPQRAQIEDIVKRKAEVGADQIIITLLNMAE
ncbi:MAG: SpoIIIAH-like family protein [Clostridiaceae bacterium]|uniref:SpoIIIAH-like family protein n=2 Tax=Clostridium TaxID=1485 RepID=A0A7X2NNR3_9CLOT|nr:MULTISPECIES: SpoIIIAH-like family protein [Clostridium]MCI6140420.1 SpoIIIAH-like family protein [Clostridium sp.]MDY3230011.1 SpoIIIAH-like family protein [Clostridiaceae bacterium]MSS38076.1 SpoIIIAH-like family protein [Clostridium porci]